MQNVWHAIITFVLQNLPLVIGWLVFISASALLAPFIAQRIRRSTEKRDEHLAELKNNLLNPMLAHLNDYILPILERRRGNVGIDRKFVRRQSAGLLEDPTVYVETICVRDASEPPIDPIMYPAQDATDIAPWMGALYDDAARHHFQNLCNAWEQLLKVVERYHQSCITYVEALRSEVLQVASLPELDIGGKQPHWVAAANFAVVLFYRQLDLYTAPLARVPEGNIERLTYKGAQTLVQGPSAEVTKYIAKADALIARSDMIDALRGEACQIGTRALRVKSELEELLLIRRLRGRCQYLA